jgi:hypothetical protein
VNPSQRSALAANNPGSNCAADEADQVGHGNGMTDFAVSVKRELALLRAATRESFRRPMPRIRFNMCA